MIMISLQWYRMPDLATTRSSWNVVQGFTWQTQFISPVCPWVPCKLLYLTHVPGWFQGLLK